MCRYCEHIEKKYFNSLKNGDLRVWWMPQVGSAAGIFYYPVKDIAEAKHILEMLAFYDLFQHQHHIKPDFANTGGLQIYDETEENLEDRWCDWYSEDGYNIDEVDDNGELLGD